MLSEMASTPTEVSLQKHHGVLKWTTWWRDDTKTLRAKRFGKSTDLGAKAARAAFEFWKDTEWKAKDHVRNPHGSAATYTVTRLAAQYLRFARRYFLKNGKPTSHVTQIRYAMRELRDTRGDRPAETMESPDLAQIRDGMIHAERVVRRKNPETGVVEEVVEEYTRSMKTVNDRLLIMKQAFEWAREKGRIPRPVVLDLNTVNPLQRGRTEAKNPKDILPIAADIVDATLTALTPTVRAMVEVNMYTGARPGEVCVLRGCDLEMVAEDCWVFTPHSHKMEHKGIKRKVALGPKAIAAVRPHLSTDLQAYIFSPSKAVEEQRAAKRKAREAAGTPLYPSHLARIERERAESPPARRAAGERYTEASYRKAIHYACKKIGIASWNPNQLRHTHGTLVREVFGIAALQDAGLEAAQATLGHQDSRTSTIYAEESVKRAMIIARRVG